MLLHAWTSFSAIHRESREGEEIHRLVQHMVELRPRVPVVVGALTWSGISSLLCGCLAAHQ
jgi:hypothetical protein